MTDPAIAPADAADVLTPLEPGQPRVALVVAAHPDDVDFGAGATVAKLVGAGWRVAYCIVTDGDAGGFDPAVPRERIPAIRRAEQTEAARRLGVSDLHWLGFRDGALVVDLPLRREIARVIRTVRPTRVLCPSPVRDLSTRIGFSHPDHIAAGEAALCAVYPDARNPFAFPELAADGHEAFATSEVWIMGGPGADLVVDVTDTFDRKVHALLAHESQLTDPGGLHDRLRQRAAQLATDGGLPTGRLAEAFRRLDTR